MDDLFIRKKAATCTVNPGLGEERDFEIKPAGKAKKVLVIGGGPGGMEAAWANALRGHKVTLWEKSNRLGGLLNIAVKPPYKAELGAIVEYLPAQINKLGVKVELEKEATVESVLEFGPDAVVVATGASPAVLNIPGVNGNNVVTAVEVLADEVEVGKEVIIIGGGLVGCETADFLSERGRQVTILEIVEQMAGDLNHTIRKMLLGRLERAGVRMVTKVESTEITGKGVKAVSDGSALFFPGDTMILAVGMKSNNELARALEGKVPELYTIGDSAEPREIFDAIYEGAHTSVKI